MITLDDTKIKAMSDLTWQESVAEGTAIIKEGDLNADYFYVVASGSFEVTKAEAGKSATEHIAKSNSIATLAQGTSFGELALLYFAPRAATITATADSSVFVLARQQFQEILRKAQADVASTYVKYLDKVKILDPLKDTEKKQLAEALTDFSFAKGEDIFVEGENGVLFYILISGSVDVIQGGKTVAQLSASEANAQFFGEKALLNNEPRGATIKVTSDNATTLAVDKKSFEMLLGSLDEITKRGKEGTATVAKAGAGGKVKEGQRFGVIQRKDLKRLGLLGCGGFGAVEMVEHTTSGEHYALKALSKGYVLKTGMQKSVMSEKDVQLMCDSVFIVKLYETYNGEQSLYLLLELALGGELYATYNKKGLWGKEPCAKFYIAGTVFAFEHLHERKIIFRDLKPENLLLNDAGKVKLTDMGLAKVVVGKTYTTCGTPDYFAPELIASKGHTEAVDWWCLGILNFELLGGHPPFESASPMQIYQKVTKGINKVQFPKACKGAVETLIKGLCQANPSERLPMKKGGTQNVKKHAWFGGFDWDKMENVTLDAPYKPLIKNKKDMANFSARKEDMPPQVPYKDPKTGWDKDFATSK
jgi:cGMP-dependent protein kinase